MNREVPYPGHWSEPDEMREKRESEAEQYWSTNHPELSIRARNALILAGIVSLQHLADITVEDIRNTRNVGINTLEEYVDLLAGHQMSFRPGRVYKSAAQEDTVPITSKLENQGWPAALTKASIDMFDYAVCVRGLGVIRFKFAEPTGKDWVRLQEIDWSDKNVEHLPYVFARGIEVRLSDIIWVADAPCGS